MAKDQLPKEQPADFESALGELEGIVEALESGDMSLAESLERFKRGVSLSRRCHELIDQARQSVEVLSDPDDETRVGPTDATGDSD